MRNFNLLGTAAILAASAAALDDNYNMDMPCFNDLCFTSWKCSYSRMSKYDDLINDRCNVPQNVYTPANDGSRWNTMVWDFPYYMTWTSSFETQTEDIVLEWLIFETPGSPLPSVGNSTEMTMEYSTDGPVRYIVAHSESIDKGTSGWTFTPRLSDFPNSHLNASPIAVAGYAMERNAFRIYHPKTFDPRNESTWDISWGFSVIRQPEEEMIRRAAQNHVKAGNKKLAIGVGVGVTVAWFVAFVVSWFASARVQRKRLEREGLLAKMTYGSD